MSTPNWNSTSSLGLGFLPQSPEGKHLPILAVALLAVVAGSLYLDILPVKGPLKTKGMGIPTVRRPRLLDAYRSGVWWRVFVPRLVPYLEEGYYKYSKNGQPFRIWLYGFQSYAYILPEKYLERIKNMPASEVSFSAVVNKYVYAGLPDGGINNLMVQVVSKLLNANLATIKSIMHGETEKALARTIGNPTEWKRLNAWDVALKTSEAPGARVMFGEALAENEGFVAGVTQYTANIIAYAFTLRYVSLGPLRHFALYLLYWGHRRSLPAVVTPLNEVIAERKRTEQSQKNLSEEEKPFDCVQWAMDQDIPDDQKTTEAIARRLILISTGTIDTVAGIMIKLLVAAASHPECHEEIRAEIREALAEDGNQGWTVKAMGGMRKLESLIQESLRMTSGSIAITGLRIVTGSKLQLDNDVVIPKGALIAFPTLGILHDGEIFPDPDKFDAFRFYKIQEKRQIAEPRSLHRDVRAGWLQFGYGRQSCPGRFYAINVMKTILGELLLRYDVRLAADGDGKRQPATDIDFDPLLIPSRSTDLEFRARR